MHTERAQLDTASFGAEAYFKPELDIVEHDSTLSLRTPDNKLTFGQYLLLKQEFDLQGLGNLKYLTNHPETIPSCISKMGLLSGPLIYDYEGNDTAFTISIETTNPHEALKICKREDVRAAMVGRGTSGTKNFGGPEINYGSPAILAIKSSKFYSYEGEGKLTTAQQVQPEQTEDSAPWYPKEGEYFLDPESKTIFAGLGISPRLIDYLTGSRTVPQKLTTMDSADHIAVYACGGQGPNRLMPHMMIKKVVVSDGERIFELTGDEVEKYEGSLGLHLAILAIEYHTFETPRKKSAFFVPLNVTNHDPSTPEGDWATQQAIVLSYLQHTFVRANTTNKKLESDWSGGYTVGAEIVTAFDTQNSKSYSPETAKTKVADSFLEKMGDSIYGLYIPVTSEDDPEPLLIDAIMKYHAFKEFGYSATDFGHEEKISDPKTLPFPEGNNPFEIIVYLARKGVVRPPKFIQRQEELNAIEKLREGLPDAAKAKIKEAKQNPNKLGASESTDSNTEISAQALEEIKLMKPEEGLGLLIALNRAQLEPYLNYDKNLYALELELAQLKKRNALAKRVAMSRNHYGHRNDPHTRWTFIADLEGLDEEARAEVVAIQKYFATKAKAAQKLLSEETVNLRKDPRLKVLRGEKGRIPHLNLLTQEEVAWILNQLEEDPNDTSKLLAWRIQGSPQEKQLRAMSAA